MIYLIDANVIIEFSNSKNWDKTVFETLCNFLESQISKGEIIFCEIVKEECADPTSRSWLDSMKSIKIVPTTQSFQEINDALVNKQYDERVVQVYKGKKDYQIIASALSNSYGIITNEKSNNFLRTDIKIPDICSFLNIKCIKFIDYLKSLNFTC